MREIRRRRNREVGQGGEGRGHQGGLISAIPWANAPWRRRNLTVPRIPRAATSGSGQNSPCERFSSTAGPPLIAVVVDIAANRRDGPRPAVSRCNKHATN